MSIVDENALLRGWMHQFKFLETVQIVESVGAYRPPTYQVRPDPSHLPLTRLVRREDIFAIVAAVERVLVGRLDYNAAEIQCIVTIVSELCQNIYRHRDADLPANGYATMQVDDGGLKFMAINLGPGIPTHLRDHFPNTSDWQVIRRACDAGVTSKDSGGLGLYRVAQLVQQAGGQMRIRSGDAGAVLDAEGKWARAARDGRNYLWGAQIGIEIPKIKHGR